MTTRIELARRGRAAAIGALACTLLGVAVEPAAADRATATEPPRSCKSADLRYPFEPGGPRTFGVFRLRIAGGSCRTAHRVAKAWMSTFEASVSAGRLELPRSVAGFKFTSLPANAAQTYRERGRRRTTTIRFDYRIPNG